MTNPIHNRRTFLSTAAAIVAAGAPPSYAVSSDIESAAETFLKDWVTARNKHDAHALAALHTQDAVTINRYGTVLRGRQDAEEALSFLLGPQGLSARLSFLP